MDKNNIMFFVTDGEHGYKAGDFFTAALEIVFGEHTTQERYNQFETMVAHADARHIEELYAAFPKQTIMVQSTFSGEHTRTYAFGYTMTTMRVLSALLPMALPELAAAIKEYSQS